MMEIQYEKIQQHLFLELTSNFGKTENYWWNCCAFVIFESGAIEYTLIRAQQNFDKLKHTSFIPTFTQLNF